MNLIKRIIKRTVIGIVLMGLWTAGMSIVVSADNGENGKSEGTTAVTAYVSTEPETPSDHPDNPDSAEDSDTDGGKDTDNPDYGDNSENSGRNAKTGDRTEIDHLIYIVMGSFIIMMCGIIILCVDNFKKKEDEC